ncbi:MAG: ATP-binding cassette domain-containing protein [Boseongicola sp.]|nr:ATP-binding cassette domain-containing protein [Boseongicola sp.]NNJ68108.1 ATP-binding cassette domain-containing protein [Boseongicola sp.]
MLELNDIALKVGDFDLSANLSIAGPGVTAVIGPSGGGKSTLLSLIAGFQMPDKGRLFWNGTDITDLSPGARPVAMLFQDNNLFPHLDSLTNVALGAAPVAHPSSETKERARDALKRVGLAGLESRKPGGLSGGQQSRVALARLLLTNRPIILMDEPFSALGPSQRQEMLALIKELLPAATILMVTHDPDDARDTKQTVVISNGFVSPPRETTALFADPPAALHAYLR